MGLFDFFKKKEPIIEQVTSIPMQFSFGELEYPIVEFQKPYVVAEIESINSILKELKYTKHLHLDSSKLTPNSCYSFTPFTTKTRKISKFPCMLKACSTVYMGYTLHIYYDINDIPGKAMLNCATPDLTYTIDFKNVNGTLQITKVVTTNSNLDNEKLYHVMASGEIYCK